MHQNSALRVIGNMLAAGLIVAGTLYGLESCGWHTGVPQLLVCRVGGALITGTMVGLVPWGIAIGLLLLVLPVSRGSGITLLALSVGGLVVMEVWHQQTAGMCGGASVGGGFTP